MFVSDKSPTWFPNSIGFIFTLLFLIFSQSIFSYTEEGVAWTVHVKIDGDVYKVNEKGDVTTYDGANVSDRNLIFKARYAGIIIRDRIYNNRYNEITYGSDARFIIEAQSLVRPAVGPYAYVLLSGSGFLNSMLQGATLGTAGGPVGMTAGAIGGLGDKIATDMIIGALTELINHPEKTAVKMANQAWSYGLKAYRANYNYMHDVRKRQKILSYEEVLKFFENDRRKELLGASATLSANIIKTKYNTGDSELGNEARDTLLSTVAHLKKESLGQKVDAILFINEIKTIVDEALKGLKRYTPYTIYSDTLSKINQGYLEAHSIYYKFAIKGEPVKDMSTSGGVSNYVSNEYMKFEIAMTPIDINGNFIDMGLYRESLQFRGVNIYTIGADGIEIPFCDATDVKVTRLETIKGAGEKQLLGVMVLDSSGSMKDNDPNRRRVEAAKQFVNMLRNDDELAIVDFGLKTSAIRLIQDFSSNKSLLSIAVEKVVQEQGTPLNDAMMYAIQLINSKQSDVKYSPNVTPTILLLTDGVENQSSHSLNEVISAANKNGVSIFVIGLGNGIELNNLVKMAVKTHGGFSVAGQASELIGAFENQMQASTKGRIVVYGEGSFSKNISPGVLYRVRGNLEASINGGTVVTPFIFTVQIQ